MLNTMQSSYKHEEISIEHNYGKNYGKNYNEENTFTQMRIYPKEENSTPKQIKSILKYKKQKPVENPTDQDNSPSYSMFINTPPSKKKNKTLWIALGISGGLCVIIIVIFLYFWKFRKFKKIINN